MNNDKFRNEFAKKITKAKNKTELFVKKFIVDLDARLVQRSPVLTGRFRANWVVGNGAIDTTTTENTTVLNKSGEINAIKVNGQTIFLSNSLPYAQKLEYGYSKQSPSGMVRVTLVELSSIANKVGIELKAMA